MECAISVPVYGFKIVPIHFPNLDLQPRHSEPLIPFPLNMLSDPRFFGSVFIPNIASLCSSFGISAKAIYQLLWDEKYGSNDSHKHAPELGRVF